MIHWWCPVIFPFLPPLIFSQTIAISKFTDSTVLVMRIYAFLSQVLAATEVTGSGRVRKVKKVFDL